MTGDSGEIIVGRIPVAECLRAGRRTARRLHMLRDARGLAEIEKAAFEIPIERHSRQELDRLAKGATHQGVILFADPLPVLTLHEWLAQSNGKASLVVVLDGIQDPQNFGGILRSAAACGVDAVVFPKDRAAPLSQVAIKAAAGGVEHVNLVRETNLVRALDQLKDAGFWIAGLSPTATQILWEADFSSPTALVIGSEGQGIRPLVLRHCDHQLRIPLPGSIDSLNASVAAGLALGEILRQRTVPKPDS